METLPFQVIYSADVVEGRECFEFALSSGYEHDGEKTREEVSFFPEGFDVLTWEKGNSPKC